MALGTLLRLLVASLVVGVALAWLDVAPGSLLARGRALALEAFAMTRSLVERLVESGGDVVAYVLTGAVVVIPLWLLGRLWRALRRRD